MSHDVLEDRAERRRHSREAIVSRLILLTCAALCLGSSTGCGRSPAAPAPAASTPAAAPTPGEVIFGKMRAAIESVSRGVVQVEDQTRSHDGHLQSKRTFRLVFDDSHDMLRCDSDKEWLSGPGKGRRQTKYARNATESLFQLITERDYGGIEVGYAGRIPPYDNQPLDPHVLWFAYHAAYLRGGPYSDVLRACFPRVREAKVSTDSADRLVLTWMRPRTLQRLVIDPKLGFV